MTTLRSVLTELNFNWKKGKIVSQEYIGYSPGWATKVLPGEYIKEDNPILDLNYNSGYGSPECPRIIAKDNKAIYFPCQYDGASWIQKVIIDLDEYTKDEVIPYPGG